MGRPKVFVTRKVPYPGLEILNSEELDVQVSPYDRAISRQELLEAADDVDAILCYLTDKIDAELMGRAPGLKVVSSYSVGYDHIDVSEATRRGIYVTNTPGVLTDAAADHAWPFCWLQPGGSLREIGLFVQVDGGAGTQLGCWVRTYMEKCWV